MKIVLKIAKAELQTLFYSPIAWLILIIFTFQASVLFTNVFEMNVRSQSLEYQLNNVTQFTFSGIFGMFRGIQQYLYLYIPLLTMGLMSRELNSGSIKLLYSSPVTNREIVLGKYLTMVVYALLLMAILFVYVLYGACTIKAFDFPAVLTGLLGLYLLTCAYGAIGLFVSSLTSYQVVAAMGTLAILAALSLVRGVWQDIDIVRDITYWLSIDGRADQFVMGLICSEDVLYFFILIVLFITLTILRLQVIRQKTRWTLAWGRYLGVFFIAVVLGYLTSRPQFMCFYDATRTKAMTLTPNSQKIMSHLDGDLTITTYVNVLDKNVGWGLPSGVKQDMDRFEMYLRFKPDIKMKYVYYYDTVDNISLNFRYPGLSSCERMLRIAETYDLDTSLIKSPEEIRQIIDLSGEGNRFVRLLERGTGERTFLRLYDDFNNVFPTESEISAAFKHLVMQQPLVGFVTGHGERSITRGQDRDYRHFTQDKPFRFALINQGFDIAEINLSEPLPSNLSVLVVADPRRAFTPDEMKTLNDYIARGGNLLFAGEFRQQDMLNPLIEPFGVRLQPGCIVKPSEDLSPEYVGSNMTIAGAALNYIFNDMEVFDECLSTPTCVALDYDDNHGYKVTPLLVTDSRGSWNELQTTNFADDTVHMDISTGEREQSHVTSVALSRQVNDKEQRVIILGDADCFSNAEIDAMRKGLNARNYAFIRGAFSWLTYEQAPIDVRRLIPPDNEVYVGKQGMAVTKYAMTIGLPVILLIVACIIWFRRRMR